MRLPISTKAAPFGWNLSLALQWKRMAEEGIFELVRGSWYSWVRIGPLELLWSPA